MTILDGTSARRHVGTSARRHVGTSARPAVPGRSSAPAGPSPSTKSPPRRPRRAAWAASWRHNVPTGVAGWAAGQAPRDADLDAPPRGLGIPGRFPLHAWHGEVPADTGLTPVGIAGPIGAALAAMEDAATAARKENDA